MPGIIPFLRSRSPIAVHSTRATRPKKSSSAIAHLEDIIVYEGGDRVTALLIEPIVGSNGVVLYPDGRIWRAFARCAAVTASC